MDKVRQLCANGVINRLTILKGSSLLHVINLHCHSVIIHFFSSFNKELCDLFQLLPYHLF
jgi:hypothetical protein